MIFKKINFAALILTACTLWINGCRSVTGRKEISEPLLSPPSILGGDESFYTNRINLIGSDRYSLNQIRVRFFSSHNAGFGEETMFVQIAHNDDLFDEVEIVVSCYDQTNGEKTGNTHTWPLKVISRKKFILSKSLTEKFAGHMSDGCMKIGHIPFRPVINSVVVAACVDGELRGGWMYRTDKEDNLLWQDRFEKVNLQLFEAIRIKSQDQTEENIEKIISKIFAEF